MATTTTEGTPSQADGTPVSGLPPAPFHLCFDGLDDGVDEDCDAVDAILNCEFADGPDDDAFFANVDDAPFFADCDDVSDELSRSELIDLEAVLSSDNVRSHAEVPEPDGFDLPSHDCIVYRALAPHNVRGGEPPLDAIVVRSTSLSELQFEALSIGRRLQDAGAQVYFGRPMSRGMGRELTVSFVRARPEVLGFWCRDLSEELTLPAPARVPAEAREVRMTERPGAWRGAA